jgi:hypothetical protein
VVRDGKLIGMLTRTQVLQALDGDIAPEVALDQVSLGIEEQAIQPAPESIRPAA